MAIVNYLFLDFLFVCLLLCMHYSNWFRRFTFMHLAKRIALHSKYMQFYQFLQFLGKTQNLNSGRIQISEYFKFNPTISVFKFKTDPPVPTTNKNTVIWVWKGSESSFLHILNTKTQCPQWFNVWLKCDIFWMFKWICSEFQCRLNAAWYKSHCFLLYVCIYNHFCAYIW